MSEGNEASDVVLTEDKPAEDRTYTAAEVAKIVQDRLKRVKKEPEQADDNLVNDLRSKYDQQVSATKALTDKLSRMGERTVKATVEARLAEAGCLDPELVAESFLSRKVVSLDDDDQIKVSNAKNSLDELVKDTLAAKPWLVRPSGPGLGSRSPKVPEAESNDPSQMTSEQLLAKLGGTSAKKSLWTK